MCSTMHRNGFCVAVCRRVKSFVGAKFAICCQLKFGVRRQRTATIWENIPTLGGIS